MFRIIKKYDKSLSIYLLVLFLTITIGLIGVSYAYFSVDIKESVTEVKINSNFGCPLYTIQDSDEGKLYNMNVNYPIEDDLVLQKIKPLKITIKKECIKENDNIPFVLATIKDKDSNTDDYIKDEQIKIMVNKINNDANETLIPTSYLSDINKLEDTELDKTIDFIKNNEEYNKYNVINYYKITSIDSSSDSELQIYLWIDYYEGDRTQKNSQKYNNTTQNKKFNYIIDLIS